jgi:hypothetical protein
MVKLFISGAVIVAVAVVVYFIGGYWAKDEVTSKLDDLLSGSVERWEFDGASVAPFSSAVVITGLNLYLNNGWRLHAGRLISDKKGGIDEAFLEISDIALYEITHEKPVLNVNWLRFNNTTLDDLDGADFADLALSLGTTHNFFGYSKPPSFDFTSFDAKDVVYSIEGYTINIGELRFEYELDSVQYTYTAAAQNISVNLNGLPNIFIDNITNEKVYNSALDSLAVIYALKAGNLAEININGTLASEASQEFLPVEFNIKYTDKGFTEWLCALLGVISGSDTEGGRKVLKDTLIAVIDRLSAYTASTEVIESFERFIDNPQTMTIDYNRSKTVTLILNSNVINRLGIPKNEEPVEIYEYENGDNANGDFYR